MNMTYSEFLLIFIIPLVVVGAVAFRRTEDPFKAYYSFGIFLLAVVATVYTTPWDNYLVMTGVWSYSDERILFRIGYVPIEEYCFFILQTYLTGFWCFFVRRRMGALKAKANSTAGFWLGLIFWIVLFLAGILAWSNPSTKYLSLILVWAVPVAILQWSLGGRNLIANWRLYAASLLPPTIYLWAVDSIAIALEVWSISSTQTTGIKFGVLPVEEAVFFLMTNIMLVQGLILFVSMRAQFPQVYAKLKLGTN